MDKGTNFSFKYYWHVVYSVMDMLIAKMKYNYYTILGSKNYPYHKSKERNYSTCQISTNEVEQNEKTIYKATMGQVEKNEMLFFLAQQLPYSSL